MTKYLIKETATGTENNKNFKGESRIVYLAKGHRTNSYRNIFEDDFKGREGLLKCLIRNLANEYGYSSLSSCLRAMEVEKKHNDWEESHGFNTFKLEVYEVEI